jgi:hypothetical protein
MASIALTVALRKEKQNVVGALSHGFTIKTAEDGHS